MLEPTPPVGPEVLAAAAPEPARFICVTGPLSPGLSTRTDTRRFDAPCWLVSEAAPVVEAEPGAGFVCVAVALEASPEAGSWDVVSLAAEAILALATPATPFTCVIEPSSPGLATLTTTTVLAEAAWTAPAARVAVVATGVAVAFGGLGSGAGTEDTAAGEGARTGTPSSARAVWTPESAQAHTATAAPRRAGPLPVVFAS